MCSLDAGSTPVKFEWLKNGIPIIVDDRVDVGTTQDVSTLTLRQLKREDAANYTCIAKNKDGMDAFTARLRMRSELPSVLFDLHDN